MKIENRNFFYQTLDSINDGFFSYMEERALDPSLDLTSTACAKFASYIIDPLFSLTGKLFEGKTVTMWGKTINFSDLKEDTLIVRTKRGLYLISSDFKETGLQIKIAKAFIGAVIAGALCSYLKKDLRQCMIDYTLTVCVVQTNLHFYLHTGLKDTIYDSELGSVDTFSMFPYILANIIARIGLVYRKIKRYPSISATFFLASGGLGLAQIFLKPLLKIENREKWIKDEDAKICLISAIRIGVLISLMRFPLEKWKNIPTSCYKWEAGFVVGPLALHFLLQSKRSPMYEG